MTSDALFPPPAWRLAIDDGLTRSLADADARVERGGVVPAFDRARFQEQLCRFNFERPIPLQQAIDWTIEQMELGLVHVTHPRYFGLFNPAPTFPAQCADRISGVFNPQLATSTTSPAAVEIESHVIRAVAGRIGLPPDARGHFTTGGAEANYTAVILALTRLNPGFATHGVRALGGPATFYVSRESHLAWLKIAHQAGLGRSAVRLVATDGSGRMDIAALAAAIAADRDRGCVPFMIAATAGTTNAGMIDPLRDCIGLAEANGLWCHVDAAWGGGLIASSTHRARLAGIEQADSVTVDAHKWFATTMGCGMFLTRWPGLLASAFTASASYMPSNIPDADPYVNSVQWSRRFLGLRLFLSLAAAGWDGYGRHVEHALSMIDLLRQRLKMRGWRIANTSETGVLCIVPPDPGAVLAIVRRVVESGRAWISVAMFEGEQVIRACVCNGTTSEQDIATLEEALTAAAEPIY